MTKKTETKKKTATKKKADSKKKTTTKKETDTKPKRTPKKKEEPEEDLWTPQKAREAALASIRKRHGAGTVRRASELPDIFSLRRPSGIPSLDIILKGGFPAGGPVHIIGKDGAGKTDLSWRMIAQAQKNYGDNAVCAFASIEHWPDTSQARLAGVTVPFSDAEIRRMEAKHGEEFDDEEMYHLKKEIGVVDFPGAPTTAGILEEVVDMYQSGAYQIIVVDSIGAMATEAEMEVELGQDARTASLATLITQFMKRIWQLCRTELAEGIYNETTLVILNQWRSEVRNKNPQMSDLRIGGGNALRHGKLVDLLVQGGGKVRKNDNKEGDVIGKKVYARVLKGKAGMHEGDTAEWRFIFGEGVDVPYDVLTVGMEMGLIEMGGSWYHMPDGKKYQGKHRAKRHVMEFYDDIMERAVSVYQIPDYRVT